MPNIKQVDMVEIAYPCTSGHHQVMVCVQVVGKIADKEIGKLICVDLPRVG